MANPPVCDYEGSDYQSSFWEHGNRVYEDQVEAIALRRLLPPSGRLLLELGAGAGRHTTRYTGFERIVLLDYSSSQLEQAQAKLGASTKYVFVAADVYRLPFVEGLFDAATMIRVLHHMADAPRALKQVHAVLSPNGTFVLEFANKQNLKSILRYVLRRQTWNPFTREPVEFAALNFDFHPAAVRGWLEALGFRIERMLAVSHFRVGLLKRLIPASILVRMDSLLQWTGMLWQLTPSVFLSARTGNAGRGMEELPSEPLSFFKCPVCDHRPLIEGKGCVKCSKCGRQWGVSGAIYDFRQPLATVGAA